MDVSLVSSSLVGMPNPGYDGRLGAEETLLTFTGVTTTTPGGIDVGAGASMTGVASIITIGAVGAAVGQSAVGVDSSVGAIK